MLSPRVAASVLLVAAAFLGGIALDELGHRELRPNPYVDDDDPWSKAKPVGERPGPGF